jgi:hypothetical protein
MLKCEGCWLLYWFCADVCVLLARPSVWKLCLWPVCALIVLGYGGGDCRLSLFLLLCFPAYRVRRYNSFPFWYRPQVLSFAVPVLLVVRAYFHGSALFYTCACRFSACFPTHPFSIALYHTHVLTRVTASDYNDPNYTQCPENSGIQSLCAAEIDVKPPKYVQHEVYFTSQLSNNPSTFILMLMCKPSASLSCNT